MQDKIAKKDLFVWMLKIILPISLATFLPDYSGWLHHIDTVLEPLMGVLRLPAMAVLPLLAGLLTGIYGGIVAMSILPFTIDQMTLMAVFLLIAHNLIQEGVIQHQSGCPSWRRCPGGGIDPGLNEREDFADHHGSDDFHGIPQTVSVDRQDRWAYRAVSGDLGTGSTSGHFMDHGRCFRYCLWWCRYRGRSARALCPRRSVETVAYLHRNQPCHGGRSCLFFAHGYPSGMALGAPIVGRSGVHPHIQTVGMDQGGAF